MVLVFVVRSPFMLRLTLGDMIGPCLDCHAEADNRSMLLMPRQKERCDAGGNAVFNFWGRSITTQKRAKVTDEGDITDLVSSEEKQEICGC